MDVSIIIINYNTKQMTSECIDSVIEHTKNIEYEIILVDNASSDGSKEFFEKDSRVRYIYSKRNAGFGAGNNLGAKYATGKYLLLLNSDTLLNNNAIKMFYDYAEANNQRCVYGGWLQDREGKPNESQFPFPRMGYVEFIKSFFTRPKAEDRTSVMHVDAVVGADMFLLKDVYDEANGFDEHIFMYGEETELQYRLKKMGVDRMIIPGPKVVHFGGASGTSKNTVSHMDSHYYFLKKHMPWYRYASARIFYGVNFLIRWIMNINNTKLIRNAFLSIK